MKLHFTKEWLKAAADAEEGYEIGVGFELFQSMPVMPELLAASIDACAVAQEECRTTAMLAMDDNFHDLTRKDCQRELREKSAVTRRLLFAIIDHGGAS